MASASLTSLMYLLASKYSGVEVKMCFLEHGNGLKREGKKDEGSGRGEALYGRGMLYLDGQARPNAKLKLQIQVMAENFFFVREAQ
ncbi:hypothetical protein BOTNAR_0017g00190 [Botryotinia narcissicola]|uniref:Uncharacterized protein n=1 Tax=Botryotinia narcissicola TaxID=278944 RepID=A0A4Z1J5U6_9HELO|nr:hypothetical protein BOTNAR_0017g00190 [Botryotinia narcissicola]